MTNPYSSDMNGNSNQMSPAHAAGAIVIMAILGLAVLNRVAISLRVG